MSKLDRWQNQENFKHSILNLMTLSKPSKEDISELWINLIEHSARLVMQKMTFMKICESLKVLNDLKSMGTLRLLTCFLFLAILPWKITSLSVVLLSQRMRDPKSCELLVSLSNLLEHVQQSWEQKYRSSKRWSRKYVRMTKLQSKIFANFNKVLMLMSLFVMEIKNLLVMPRYLALRCNRLPREIWRSLWRMWALMSKTVKRGRTSMQITTRLRILNWNSKTSRQISWSIWLAASSSKNTEPAIKKSSSIGFWHLSVGLLSRVTIKAWVNFATTMQNLSMLLLKSPISTRALKSLPTMTTMIKKQYFQSTQPSFTISSVQIGLERLGHSGCSLPLAIPTIRLGELTCASSADLSCKLLSI